MGLEYLGDEEKLKRSLCVLTVMVVGVNIRMHDIGKSNMTIFKRGQNGQKVPLLVILDK